jgi:hypothetical protein
LDSWTAVESTVLSDFFDGFMALCVSGRDIMVIMYVRSIQHVGEWYPYGGGWLGVDAFINELLGMWVCVQKINHNFFNSKNYQETQQRKTVQKQHPNFNFPIS